MGDNELFEHRISSLEDDVKILYGKTNSFAVSQAQANTKLDNMIQTLDEVKESLAQIQKRPSVLWDKFLFALVGAIGTGIGALIMLAIKGG